MCEFEVVVSVVIRYVLCGPMLFLTQSAQSKHEVHNEIDGG